jgi:hypothetical protein
VAPATTIVLYWQNANKRLGVMNGKGVLHDGRHYYSSNGTEPVRIRAALVETTGGPFTLRDLDLEPPRADEVLIRVTAAGSRWRN